MTTTKESKEFVYALSALFARYEHDQRSHRIKAALRAKKKRQHKKK